MAAAVLERAWREQSVWSQVAGRLKDELERNRRWALALTVAGALLSAAAVTAGLDSPAGKVLAGASAVAVGLAGIVHSRADLETVRDWTRARSVSEAIKSEVYQRLAGVGEDGDVAFDERIAEVERDGDDLLRYKAGVMPVARELPPVRDVASYVDLRIGGQIDNYYRPRGANLRRKLELVRRAELCLAAAGVVLAAVAGAVGASAVAVWVPVVTTIASAVTAHAAAARYEYQLVEFTRTAEELERLRDRRGAAAALSDAELIASAEHVISVQNEGWMAKLAGD